MQEAVGSISKKACVEEYSPESRPELKSPPHPFTLLNYYLGASAVPGHLPEENAAKACCMGRLSPGALLSSLHHLPVPLPPLQPVCTQVWGQ